MTYMETTSFRKMAVDYHRLNKGVTVTEAAIKDVIFFFGTKITECLELSLLSI